MNKVTVRENDLIKLIKQLKKYNKIKEIDCYTVALYMADKIFPTYMSTNMCSMVQYLLERNDSYDAVYRLMDLCNIEIDTDTDPDFEIKEV